MTSAGFNRRMRKTACPVVWKGHGAKSPCPHPISNGTGCHCVTRCAWGREAECYRSMRTVPDGGNGSFT